jgi:hypothetical protein
MPFQAGSDHQFSSQTSQLEAEESLAGFIKEVVRPVVPTILKTSARKAKHLRQAEATAVAGLLRKVTGVLRRWHKKFYAKSLTVPLINLTRWSQPENG